jgi:hypothetical protein
MIVEGTQIVRSTVDVDVNPVVVITQLRNAVFSMHGMPIDCLYRDGMWVKDDDNVWFVLCDKQPTPTQHEELIAMNKAVKIVYNHFGIK